MPNEGACLNIDRSEKALAQLKASKLTPEMKQAFEDLYAIIANEDQQDITMETQYFTKLAHTSQRLIRMGAVTFKVPLPVTVAVLKAYHAGDGPKLFELLDAIVESAQRQGGRGAIYVFKKKQKQEQGTNNKINKILKQTEQRAWRSTLKFLHILANEDYTFSQQLRRSLVSMLESTRSYCLLLRSVVKEIPAWVGYLLLVDSQPWGSTDRPYALSIKEIRESVLEAMIREP